MEKNTSANHISRRNFLKSATLASAGFLVDLIDHPIISGWSDTFNNSDQMIGRVLFDQSPSYKEPLSTAKIVKFYHFNDLLNIYNRLIPSDEPRSSESWYELVDGNFIQSRSIQLVRNRTNDPQQDISLYGVLGEVTVPFTTAWYKSKISKKPNQVFFFGSTHWIYGLDKDKQGKPYYLVIEDRWQDRYYVDATHIRIIKEEELQPISPEIPLEEKRIIVNRKEQRTTAYEQDQPVFSTKCSTGLLNSNPDLATPAGEYKVNYKRPSRHMAHSDRVGLNNQELFGVPWVTYFTNTGIAFHGTYWHNDFTKAQSHGCVNLPISAARWLYLWTNPVVPSTMKSFVSRYGTAVLII